MIQQLAFLLLPLKESWISVVVGYNFFRIKPNLYDFLIEWSFFLLNQKDCEEMYRMVW